jgi:hypothetical protein
VSRAARHLGNRAAVLIAHAATATISRHDLIESSYPLMAAMRVNMLFAALFVLINVFSAGYRLRTVRLGAKPTRPQNASG